MVWAARAQAAPAEPPATSAPATSARAVLDAYTRALGGPEPWKAHRSLKLTGEVGLKGMAIMGTAEQLLKAPDKSLTTLTIPGVGTMVEGCNGARVWSKDPINGLRKLQGPEAARLRIHCTWDAEIQLPKHYPKQRLVPSETPGQDCVELTPKVGAPVLRCFDRKTALLVSESGKEPTPQGDTPYSTAFSEWRAVGGMMMPNRMVITTGPITIEMRTTATAVDPPIDDAAFALPTADAPAGKASASAPAADKPAPKPAAP